MLHALLTLALLCSTASADYIIKQQFTDAGCTNAFLALSIQPSGCMGAPPGSPNGPSMVECTSPTSANLKNYAPGDSTCSGAALAPSTVNAVDGKGAPLASWRCTLGSDNVYWTHSCVTGPLPSTYTVAGLGTNTLLAAASSGACPISNAFQLTYVDAVGSCRPTDVSAGGAILYGRATCSATTLAATQKYTDSACTVAEAGSTAPPPVALGCASQPCGPSCAYSVDYACNTGPGPSPSNTPSSSSLPGTASNTPTPSSTASDTPTPSNTATGTDSPSNTASGTGTPSNTPTASQTLPPGVTATATPTPTPTRTPSATPTPSPAAGSGRGYVLSQRFTDAACTVPFQASYIMAPTCQAPLTSSSTLYVGIFCNSPSSAQYNGYTDAACAGPSQGLVSSISSQYDNRGQPLASWGCTMGSDGVYYQSSCVVSATMPPQYDPATPQGSTNTLLVQSAGSGTACPNTAPVSQVYRLPVGTCGPFEKSESSGALLYSKATCDATTATLQTYSDAACSVVYAAPSPAPGQSNSGGTQPLGCAVSSYPGGGVQTFYCNGAGGSLVLPSSPSRSASITATPTPPPTPSATPTPTPAAGSGRGYVLMQRFTDAACTVPFQASSIMAPTCQAPLSGTSSTLYVGIFCNSPSSAQYNGYTDSACAGPSQGLVSSISSQYDNRGQQLASWGCTMGSDGVYYQSSCVVSATMPPQFDPATPQGSTNTILVQSAGSGTACPNTAPVSQVGRLSVGTCGPSEKLESSGALLYSKATCDATTATLLTYTDAACSVVYTAPSPAPGQSNFGGTQRLGCAVSSYPGGGVQTFYCNGAGGSLVLPASPSRSNSATPTQTPTQTPSRSQASASTRPTYSSSPSAPPKFTSAPRVCGELDAYDRAALLLPQGVADAVPNGCPVSSGPQYGPAATTLPAGGLCRQLVGVCTRPSDYCGAGTSCVGACAVSCERPSASGAPPAGLTYWGCPPGVPLGSVFSYGSLMAASEVAAYAANYARGGVAPGGLGIDYSQLALTIVLCRPGPGGAASCSSSVDASTGAAAPGSEAGAVANCPATAYVAPSPSALASTSNTATYTATGAAGASPTGTPRPTPAASPTPSTTPIYAATSRACAYLQDFQRALVPVPKPQTFQVTDGCWVTDIDAATGTESRTQQSRPPGALCVATAGVCTGSAGGSKDWCAGSCQVGGAASGAFFWGCPTNVASGSLWVRYGIWAADKVGEHAAAYRAGGNPDVTLVAGLASAGVVVATCSGAYSAACDPNTYATTARGVLQCPVGQPSAWAPLGSGGGGGSSASAAGLSPGGTAGLVIGLLLLAGGVGLFFTFRGLVAAYWRRRLIGGKEASGGGAVVIVSSPLGAMSQPQVVSVQHGGYATGSAV